MSELLGRDAAMHFIFPIAEDTIIEWILILVGRMAGTKGGVRPMDLVSLTNIHSNAMLPLVGCGELRVVFIVMMARKAITDILGHSTASCWSTCLQGTLALLVELTCGLVLGTKVPVHIDWTESLFPVWISKRNTTTHVHSTLKAFGDIRTSLLSRLDHTVNNTIEIVIACLWLLARTWVRR